MEPDSTQLFDMLQEILDLPNHQRPAAVDRLAGGDIGLRARLEQLLADEAEAAVLFDNGLAPLAATIMTDDEMKPADGLFGNYRVIRTLDSAGTVFEAERIDVPQRVAIKVLPDARIISSMRRELFKEEQNRLARFNHNAIVRLFDTGTLPDGRPYFVMELVAGLPVTDYCDQVPASLTQRLQIFREICAAVQHSHEGGVLHRDLKPGNILVTNDGAVKLLDFGIAIDLDPLDGETDKAPSRSMTPHYAAPEQRRGERLGTYTDVYQLGLILYELLTGRRPFSEPVAPASGEAAEEIDRLPEPPSVVARQAPPPGLIASARQWADIDAMCLKALHPRTVEPYRYVTVKDLIDDISRFTVGLPLKAGPDSMSYYASKFLRRHGRVLVPLAAFVLIVAGLIGFYTLRLAQARDAWMAEALRTAHVQRLMLRLFDAGEIGEAPAAPMLVVSVLERGVREAGTLSSEPDIQASLFHTLGTLFHQLGNLPRADGLLQRALELRKSRFGGRHPHVAETLVALGLLRVDQNQHADAEGLVLEAVSISRGLLPHKHPLVSESLTALGKVYRERGRYKDAIEVLEEARDLLERDADEPNTELSGTLTQLANAHFYLGDIETSEALNRRTLEIDTRLHGHEHPSIADDLINLAAVQTARGRLDEAERNNRRALAIFSGWYPNDHPETASAMIILAQTLTARNKLDEAVDLMRRGVKTQKQVYGPVNTRVAFGLNELGVLASRRQDWDEAQAAFEESLSILRKVYPDGRHFRIGVGLSNLGAVFLERGALIVAEQHLIEAVRVLTDAQGADHVNTGIARAKLGRVLTRAKRFAEAEPHLAAAIQVLSKKAPTSSWLPKSREDIVVVQEQRRRAASKPGAIGPVSTQ